MSAHTSDQVAGLAPSRLSDPGYQAFLVLRTVFTVAPILFGLDKFFNVLTDWPQYLAGWIDGILPGTYYLVKVDDMFRRTYEIKPP